MKPSSAGSRTVVDTNLLVSGTFSTAGTPSDLLQALRRGDFLLLVSDYQITELTDVFGRPKIMRRSIPTSVTQLFYLISTVGVQVSPGELPLTVRDVKDEPILAAALGGDADYLVTGDADLLVLAGDPRLGKLRIVTAREFLDILHQQDKGAAQETNT